MSGPEFSKLGSLGSPPPTAASDPGQGGGGGGGAHGKKRPKTRPLARLAPLDHIKNLYAGANATISTSKPRRIFHKRHLIEAVRYVSPVKAALKDSKKPPRQRGVTTDGAYQEGMDSTTKALIDLEDGVNDNARRFNDLRELADRKQADLDKLTDQLRELEMEADTIQKIEQRSTPDALRIVALEKEIESVNLRKDERLLQKRQYEHMARRLKTNQVSFDAHIKGMDDALRASRKEYSEVHNLMRQLENSKTEALNALQKFQSQLAAQRKIRAKELEERRNEANNARRMEEWRKQREQKRAEMAAELRGDLTAEQEQQLLEQLQASQGQSEQLRAASLERERRATTLEEAFVQIRQATGVTTLDEMVEKFMGQGANKKALEDEKAEAERRLARVKAAQEEAEREFAEMKASGVGNTELSREVQDRKEREIVSARAQLKVNKSACDRLEGVLVAVRQGAVGLAQRLAPFAVLDDGPTDLEADGEVAKGDKDDDDDLSAAGGERPDPKTQDTLRSLRSSERILVKMLEAMAGPLSASAGAGAPVAPGSARGSVRGSARGGLGTDMRSGRLEDTLEARRTRSAHGARESAAAAAAAGSDRHPWTPTHNSDPHVHINNVRVESKKKRLADMRYPLAKETPRGGDRGGDGAGGGGGAGGGAGAGEGGGAGSGGDDDGFESGDEAPLQTRKQLKQRAQKAAETQRKARASKLRTDALSKRPGNDNKNSYTRQRDAVSRLAYSHEFTPSLAFLTQKPDLQ